MTSGRGVGLGAIRESARQLGGDAWIMNHPEGGTEFSIVLPELTHLNENNAQLDTPLNVAS